MAKMTPAQETKGEPKKKSELVQLLQLPVLATMLHPLGAQLASWTTGVNVNCGAEWSREAIDPAVPEARTQWQRCPMQWRLFVQKDAKHQVKAGFTQAAFGDKTKDGLPARFAEVSPVAGISQRECQG